LTFFFFLLPTGLGRTRRPRPHGRLPR
jgi:hypothetical protein